MDLSEVSNAELARLWVEVMIELRGRDLVRSANNPVADFAERIGADHLGLTLVDNKSAKGYDATDSAGQRYQIKGRRITPQKSSRQLSAIRDLGDRQFDFLVAVIFDQWLQLIEIWKIPHHVIKSHARYSNHVRAHYSTRTGHFWRTRVLSVLRDAGLVERSRGRGRWSRGSPTGPRPPAPDAG